MTARLTEEGSAQWPVSGTLTIGRSSRNILVIDENEVSRNHALIQPQGEGEYWLVDLGSINGTCLNGRLIVQPMRLSNGDRLRIGSREMVFHCEEEGEGALAATLAGSTVRRMRVVRRWLLVADIEGFTPLSNRLGTLELANVVGRWFASCRNLVEGNDGCIHKFLGDGWFASWEALPGQEPLFLRCLEGLLELQREGLRFRFVVHLGDVTSSGSSTGGELGMFGSDLNALFRLEKLAGQLGCAAMASGIAWDGLAGGLNGTPLGDHRLVGFEQEYRCMKIQSVNAVAAS